MSLKQKNLSLARNSSYNAIGTIVYCFCQWLITVAVMRLSHSDTDTGVLQLSMAVTNIFVSLANYSMRTYQISDVKGEFSSGEYIASRIVTCSAAILLCCGYSALWNYKGETFACITAYMVYKLNESVSDVFHAIDQKNRRMDHVGISYVCRGIFTIVPFSAVLLLTGKLFFAMLIMALCSLAVVFIYDIPVAARYDSVKPVFRGKSIIKLLFKCLPAVLAAASFAAIMTVPRQYLEQISGKETLGFYATVATPLVVVQVLVTGVMNPILTEISDCCAKRDKTDLKKLLIKVALFIAVIAAVAFAGVALLGEFALVLVYGEKVRPYVYLIYAITGCTVMYAVCSVCYNMMIILRSLVSYMVISVLCLGASATLGILFIEKFGMNGVSFCAMVCYALFIISCSAVAAKKISGWKRIRTYTPADHTFVVCAYKESEYLEDCIKSVLSQTVKSRIVVSTSTPSDFISDIAEKYGLEVRVNTGEKGIAGDWNFALRSAETPLVTLAHQDDIYEPEYLEKCLADLSRAEDPIIYFCGYGELRGGEKVYSNRLLNIKKMLLVPIRTSNKSIFLRRRSLSLGCPICCPSVTYSKSVIEKYPFESGFKSDLDWQQWERLSKLKGSFVFEPAPLMCHRIHEGSATSEIIGENLRTKEDLIMFRKFWPGFIAKKLAKLYASSEKSNDL